MSRCIALWVLLVSVLLPSVAAAETQRLALIVGVNRSVDRSAADLRFADDDAARYFDLFDALHIPAVLLTRMDEGTRSRKWAGWQDAVRRTRTPESVFSIQ